MAHATLMAKRIWHLGGWLALTTCFCGVLRADPTPAQVRVVFTEKLGPMHMERMALGQGGLSEEPMLAGRVTEIRALDPGIIRLFVQEYYDLLPERGRYHFDDARPDGGLHPQDRRKAPDVPVLQAAQCFFPKSTIAS